MTEPTISVVIPAYNASTTLPQTLAALCEMQPPAAGDYCRERWLDRRYGTDRRVDGVRVIALEKNVGAAAAKNRGAEQAQGEILFFTDADIVTPRDAIGELQAVFETRKVDAVVGLLDEKIPHSNWASQYKNSVDELYLCAVCSSRADRTVLYECGGDETRRGFWNWVGLTKTIGVRALPRTRNLGSGRGATGR